MTCYLNMCIGGVYYTLKFRQHYTTTWYKNPAMYFNSANYLCDTLLMVVVFVILAKKAVQQVRLLNMIDFHENSNNPQNDSAKNKVCPRMY